jgi:hypothetical protein
MENQNEPVNSSSAEEESPTIVVKKEHLPPVKKFSAVDVVQATMARLSTKTNNE